MRARAPRHVSRSLLVAKVAQQLTRVSTPRLHLMIMMTCAGAVAFFASVVLLRSGLPEFRSMALRYGAAALCGYAAFIALIRIWIALHRPSSNVDLDLADVTDEVVDQALDRTGASCLDVDPDMPLEAPGSPNRDERRRSSFDLGDGPSFDLDLDDLVWLALAAACILGGIAAVIYVIYSAPILLAEVALDAAVISALYRRLRDHEAGHWLTTAVTRTWVPALVVVAFAVAAGFAFQKAAPKAESIGGVIRAFTG